MPELLRKQYLVTSDNVSKLEEIAGAEGVAATEIVRRAIEAYQPGNDEGEMDKLVELMSDSVREAIKKVRSARKAVRETKKELEKKQAG